MNYTVKDKKMLIYFRRFIHSEQLGGYLLMIATVIAFIFVNIGFSDIYESILNTRLGFSYGFLDLEKTPKHWIDDGLMALFFLLIALEIKREVKSGELSSLQNAMLPGIAALGGMIIPALIFLRFNLGTDTINGWGIPMATDIAFSIAVLSLVPRVPNSLRIFLVALAVVDDIGAIIVIAIFYSGSISMIYLGLALLMIFILFTLNKFKVRSLIYYLVAGVFLWYFVLKSGVHATIAGVILGLLIPFDNDEKNSKLHKMESMLHSPVNYFILPLFALANTGILIGGDFMNNLLMPGSLGIIAGLFLGKPIGIVLSVYLAFKLKIVAMPEGTNFMQFLAVGFICGIGFTMSIFISGLAYDNLALIDNAKIAVMMASVLSAIFGYFILKKSNKNN